MSSRQIRLGALLRNSDDDGRCTLGAFARDRSGGLYALTARGAFHSGGDRNAFDANTGAPIGEMLARDGEVEGQLPFWKAIGVVRLLPNVNISWENRAEYIGGPPVARVGKLLGHSVHRGCHHDVVGSIIATYSLVKITDKFDRKVTIYFDALEARFPEPPLYPAGSAGELIVTASGRPVGLGIAGSPDRYYIAPLSPILNANGLILLRPQTQLRPLERIRALVADWDAEIDPALPDVAA